MHYTVWLTRASPVLLPGYSMQLSHACLQLTGVESGLLLASIDHWYKISCTGI